MVKSDISGDKLAADLAKTKPDISVVFCTGFSETIYQENAQSLSVEGFLLKPIGIKALAPKIHVEFWLEIRKIYNKVTHFIFMFDCRRCSLI